MTNFEINISRTCRSCLNESGNMCVIQESIKVATAGGFANGDEMSIADLMMACTKVRITHNDGLPQLICSECLFQVQQAFNYKQMCETSDTKLREFLHKNESVVETGPMSSGIHDAYDSIFVPELVISDFNGVDDPLDEDFDNDPANDFNDADFQSAFDDLEAKSGLAATNPSENNQITENDDADDDEDIRIVRQAKKINGRYQCEMCEKTLADRKTFLLHVRLHLQKKLKRCVQCNRGFTKTNHLNRHMVVHSKSFACHHCLKVFETKQQRKDHVAGDHCFASVKSKPSMITRSKSEKTEDRGKSECGEPAAKVSKIESDQTNACKLCNEAFATPEARIQHLQSVHNKTDLSVSDLTKTDVDDEFSETEVDFEEDDSEDADDDLDETEKKSETKRRKPTPFSEEELRLLNDAKEIDGRFQCSLCYRTLADRKSLKNHIRNHVGKNLKHCEICNRGFAKGSSLNRHILSHKSGGSEVKSEKIAEDAVISEADLSDGGDEEKTTINKIPKRSKPKFKRMSYDAEELRLYNDSKEIDGRFQCVLCKKILSNSKILKLHIRAHVGKNLKHCSICQRGFAKGSNLNRHMLSHRGENDEEENEIVQAATQSDGRFSCPFCIKTLSDRQTFRLHIRSHIGNRLKRCPICARGFIKQNDLDKHMAVHGDTFNCDKCDEVFQTYRERGEHLLSVHRTDIPRKVIKIESKPTAAGGDDEDDDQDDEDERLVNASKLVNGRYECQFCPKTLANKSSLKFHIRLHIGKRLHKCDICSQGFSKKSHLSRHLLTHVSKNYSCKHCDAVFSSHQERRAHINQQHKDLVNTKAKAPITTWTQSNGQKKCVCMICDAEFDRISTMRKHLLWHSDTPESFHRVDFEAKKEIFGDLLTSSEIEYTNEYLAAVLQQKLKGNCPEIVKLYRITNETGWELSLTDSESEIDEDSPETKRIYSCSRCQQSFGRLHKVMCHIRGEHGPNSTNGNFDEFKCSHCSQCYPNADVLAKHLRQQCENPLKRFICTACGNIRFMWQSSLDQHMEIYHDEEKELDTPNQIKPKPFQCDNCPKSFYRRDQLETHRPCHFPREKRFSCEICKKKFSRTDNLRTHMRVHIPMEERENVNKHLCAYCGRSFSNSSNLVVHVRRHTGEKPYKCDFCSSSFCRSSDLHCHRRTHTGEKPCLCTVCGKGFSRSNKLVRHMRIHTGDRPYKCPQSNCGRAFSQSNDLTLHIRRHTGDKPYVCGVCGERFLTNSLLRQHRKAQAHFEEATQERQLPVNSVNNPHRSFSANDGGKRIPIVGNAAAATITTVDMSLPPSTSDSLSTTKNDSKPLISFKISPSGAISTQTPIETFSGTTDAQYATPEIKPNPSFDFMM